MKYGRPVRELLADCVAVLPQPFAKTDVLEWFRSNYPDVASATVNTHIAGLTTGNRPRQHLAHYPPVMERVGHGLYRKTAKNGDAQTTDEQLSVAPRAVPAMVPAEPDQVRRVVLIGCVRSKRDTATQAKDLYTSTLFAKRRHYDEAAKVRWYIVSGRLGLVRPGEVIAPYELYLPKQSTRYRAAWGAFVAAQLAGTEDLFALTVEIHAGDAYVDALRGPLEAAGANVVDPVHASSFGATLAWYDSPEHATTTPPPAPATFNCLRATVETIADVAEVLGTETATETVPVLLARPRGELRSPGMYSWWVDAAGAEDLAQRLGHPLAPGLIYAG